MIAQAPGGALTVIVSAYAVYPLPNSAEGVVNAALLDALRQYAPLALVTSRAGYEPLRPPVDGYPVRVFAGERGARPTALDRLAGWLALPKWSLPGAAARLVDRIRARRSQAPLTMASWSRHAADRIAGWLGGDFRDAVVWARATPPESFEAAIAAWRRQPFALVANYNDPMPSSLLWGQSARSGFDALQRRQNSFLARHAQAWTFPSRRLAGLMIDAAGFDPARCFVIPHVVPAAVVDDDAPLPDGPWAIYAGTFYASVFSGPVREGIARYAQGGGRLRMLFVLKRPTDDARGWIERDVPGACLRANLAPAEAARLLGRAQAIVVADSPRHAPLLRVKVVEAARAGQPLIAFAPGDSTTADVVSGSGGIVAEPASADAVAAGLRRLEQVVLDDVPWCRLLAKRARDHFSEQRIARDSLAVLAYARQRFEWRAGRSAAEPAPPQIERWP